MEYMKLGAKWDSAPKPMLLDSLFEQVDLNKPTPCNDEPAFGAAFTGRLRDECHQPKRSIPGSSLSGTSYVADG